jgi:hypothetical protein
MTWLAEALEDLEQMGPQGGLERFAASLDAEWIEEALRATGTASVRRRKFPAEQAVWLVLGMALFADRSIRMWSTTLAWCWATRSRPAA